MSTTLAHLVETLIWAGVTIYAIRTLSGLAKERIAPTASASDDEPVIPEDLMALAMQHTESWAQEDLLRVIREKYDDYQDWNRVRAAMNIGRIDA